MQEKEEFVPLPSLRFVFALLIVLVPFQVQAQEGQRVVQALRHAEKGNWQNFQVLRKGIKTKAAQSTLDWLAYAEGSPNARFQDILTFTKTHQDWPYLDKIRLEAEKNINEAIPSPLIIEWFSQNQPLTANGMDFYARALLAQKNTAALKRVLKNWWPQANLTRDQQREFFSRYGRFLDRESHKQRLNHLLYKDQYTNAFAIADVLKGGYPALARARQALRQNKSDVNAFIAAVPGHLKRNEGLLFDRLQWRRKKSLNDGAIEILALSPRSASMTYPKSWWRERHIITRRLMEKKQYKKAYKLAASHKQIEGFPMAQAEWVSGFLALRFINQPWKAFEHFETIYKNVKSPISKARGAYWAGRASVTLKHTKIAQQWYQVAARYPETFYGQLARAKLSNQAPNFNQKSFMPSAAENARFQKTPLARAAIWLNKAGLKREASAFLLRLSKNAQTIEDYVLTINLAEKIGYHHISIKVAQALQKEKNINLYEHLYPYRLQDLKRVKNVEWAFVGAIIRQESRFDSKAISHAGARGLMQLMPATAKEVARRKGISHQTEWLTSRPSHNIALGSGYLYQMVDRFDGNYAMAAAAYNAGPGRVDNWLDEFGDPRRGEINLIDWCELIPIYETRNYVQRVLEGVYVYRHLLKGKQKPATHAIHVSTK